MVLLVREFERCYIASPLVYELAHIVGQWCREVHPLTRHGVVEGECLSVQCLAGTDLEAIIDKLLVGAGALSPEDLVATIALIAKERVVDRLHVSTYLVGASRLQFTRYERHKAQSLQLRVVCHGRLAYLTRWGVDGHACSISWITGYIALDRPLRLVELAPDECLVAPSCSLEEELSR